MMRRMLAVLAFAVLATLLICPRGWTTETRAEQRRMFREGAQLWPVYCSQCHNARPGSEFAPYQWNAIMMHMRTQANLPAKDARAVLEYLRGSH
jgi:mono/diheme cytochrome c family protein